MSISRHRWTHLKLALPIWSSCNRMTINSRWPIYPNLILLHQPCILILSVYLCSWSHQYQFLINILFKFLFCFNLYHLSFKNLPEIFQLLLCQLYPFLAKLSNWEIKIILMLFNIMNVFLCRLFSWAAMVILNISKNHVLQISPLCPSIYQRHILLHY